MKYHKIDKIKNLKAVIPVEKSKRLVLSVKNVEKPEKDVDAAQIEVNDSEFSRELKKQTDIVLREYFKADPPMKITEAVFDKDMNTAVEKTLTIQDKKRKEEKAASKARP